MGEIVDSGRPFIWFPNQLPHFADSLKDVSIRCKGSSKLVADRLDDGVPAFKEIIQLHPNISESIAMPAASSSDARPEEADPEPELPEDPPRDSRHLEVETDEEFVGREEQLLREPMSLQHRLCHMPKNPYCETCRRSRMYKRRTVRTRLDPLSDRGALPEVKGFGERIASDFIIVAKSSDGTNES